MSFSIRLKSCLLSETVSCAEGDRATLTLLVETFHAERFSGSAPQGVCSKSFLFFGFPSQSFSVLSAEGLKCGHQNSTWTGALVAPRCPCPGDAPLPSACGAATPPSSQPTSVCSLARSPGLLRASFPKHGRMDDTTSPGGTAGGIQPKPFKTRNLLGYALPPTKAHDCIKKKQNPTPNHLRR